MLQRWIGFLFFAGVVAFAVQSAFYGQRPQQATFSSVSSSQVDLESEVRKFNGIVSSPSFTAGTCAKTLEETYRRIFNVSPTLFDSGKARSEADRLMKEIFSTRLLVRKKLAEFVDRGEATPDCLNSARDFFRAGRVLEDYLGEWALDYPGYDKRNPPPVLGGGEPYLLMNPEFKNLDLRSGDVILSRGTAFTSAAIARIADVDGNFSHLSIVHIDEKTGEINTVEAHIEVGSITQTWEAYKSDGKVRAVLFRYPDARVAKEAADFIFNKVREVQRKTKENIPYDFAMDVTTPNELFCSELVSHAFSEVTAHKLEVPLFLSALTMKNRDFLSKIGVKTHVTFAPADIEVDPRFELVAEWRDFTRLNESHMHDAILTSMYDWMERENYRLYESPAAAFKKIFAWHLRRWPIFGELLKDKLPKNMSKSVIGAVSTLNEVGDALYKELEKANLANRKRTGFWLTPREMLSVLEDFRQRDLEIYKRSSSHAASVGSEAPFSGPQPAFHLFFRPG